MKSTTIRGEIHPNAISRVSRFFDASTEEIINEMLQNARRSGATVVKITIRDRKIAITDNGAGIADPAMLLSFGRSGWKNETGKSEDPAGMGFFSLARRYAVVTSRSQQPGRTKEPASTTRSGWKVALSPSVFIGNANALVEPVNNAPHPSGTRIVFSCEETDCSLGLMVHEAAKYYPLQVTVNTTVARRRPFLQDTVYTETWNGLIIGVSRDPYDARSRGINFHGSVVQHARLPGTTTVSADGQKKDARWTAEVDVEDCEQLELVLPSRRQVIQNVFLKKLEEEAQRVVYRAIAASETPRTLQHSDWAEARALGVELPEPVQELQRWQARTADAWENDNRCCNQPPPLVRKAGQRIVRMDEYNFSAAEQVTIERAFNENGENTVLVASQPVFEGYEKYDEIEVATELRTIIEKDVATTTVEEHQKAGTPLPNGRPERIVFELKTRNSKGQEHTIRAESDLAFSGETAITPGEIRVLLTTRSEITSDELTNLMIDAYFYATEDVDDGDTQRQLEHYERDCRTRATTLIHSPAEARLERLKELAGTYIANELQPGERLVIEGGTEGRHRTELCKPGPQAAPQEGPPSLGALGTVEEGEDNRNSPADL